MQFNGMFLELTPRCQSVLQWTVGCSEIILWRFTYSCQLYVWQCSKMRWHMGGLVSIPGSRYCTFLALWYVQTSCFVQKFLFSLFHVSRYSWFPELRNSLVVKEKIHCINWLKLIDYKSRQNSTPITSVTSSEFGDFE